MHRKQPDPNCDLCGGTGEVDAPVWNQDAHVYEPTGTRPCLCTIPDESDDDYDGGYGGGSQPIRPIAPLPTGEDKGGDDGEEPEAPVPSPIDLLPEEALTE